MFINGLIAITSLPELVLHDPRALHEGVRAEDPGLRLADDRCAVERAEPAGVRDRGVPPWTSSGMSFFVRARSARSAIARDAEQVEVLRVPDHGDDEALAVLERDRDAKVHVRARHDLVPRISPLIHGQSLSVSMAAFVTNAGRWG